MGSEAGKLSWRQYRRVDPMLRLIRKPVAVPLFGSVFFLQSRKALGEKKLRELQRGWVVEVIVAVLDLRPGRRRPGESTGVDGVMAGQRVVLWARLYQEFEVRVVQSPISYRRPSISGAAGRIFFAPAAMYTAGPGAYSADGWFADRIRFRATGSLLPAVSIHSRILPSGLNVRPLSLVDLESKTRV